MPLGIDLPRTVRTLIVQVSARMAAPSQRFPADVHALAPRCPHPMPFVRPSPVPVSRPSQALPSLPPHLTLDAWEPDDLASPREKSRRFPCHRVSGPRFREQGEGGGRTPLLRLLPRLLVSEAGAQYVPLGLPALPPQPRA